jgi:hypothetical protein
MKTLRGKRQRIFTAEEIVQSIIFARLPGISLREKRLLRDLQHPEA